MHKNAQKVESETQSYSMREKISRLDDAFLEVFSSAASKPSRRPITVVKRKGKEKKERRKENVKNRKCDKSPTSQDSVSTVVPSIKQKELLRRPGIEPGSTAWKAAMLTTIPPTP